MNVKGVTGVRAPLQIRTGQPCGRRWWPVVLVLFLFLGIEAAAPPDAPALASGFSFVRLREYAQALASKEYRPDSTPVLPDFLKKLNYDQYREIHFRPEKSPWRGEQLPFEIHLMQRGYLFSDPVRIHLLEGGEVRDLQFSPDQFDYGKLQFPRPVPADLQFAGLSLIYSNKPQNEVEIASFVGASYFRMVGMGQIYGASFRGLAINTAEPSGEEFPRFTDFWVEKPGEHADAIQIFALLDSPSCTGAYRFLITPGEVTRAEVEASVFLRKDITKLGVAPLTSMFLMGENRIRFIPDFRPEVHDSDGLLVKTGDKQWIWRPLVNPAKKHQVTHFPMTNPAGFGLLQRDRDFHDYEDLVSRYEERPSLWVEPRSDWGEGAVELVEIPSPAEGNDNMVAYWVPKQKATAGTEFNWKYQLSAIKSGPPESAMLRVRSTRISAEHEKVPPRFVIDFTGAGVGQDQQVEAKVQTSRGEIRNVVAVKNDVTGGWRVVFDLAGAGNEQAELRLTLFRGGQACSETWAYLYQSEPPI